MDVVLLLHRIRIRANIIRVRVHALAGQVRLVAAVELRTLYVRKYQSEQTYSSCKT